MILSNKIGIFIPVYFREELVVKCLLSLLKTNVHDYQVYVCIGINGCVKGFKQDFITRYVNNYFPKSKFEYVRVFDMGENIGKPRLINYMAKESNDFDYLVSMDSDIEITDKNWLLKFMDIYTKYNKNDEIGVLCGNFTGFNVHQVERFGLVERKLPNCTLKSSLTNVGIGGGVLVTPADVWKMNRGYNESKIFGSDDGHYLQKCVNLDKKCAYVEEISFYHPPNEDDAYVDWKNRACEGELTEEESKGYYEKLRDADI